ncbi:MAG TPA: 3'(2'),5'-bisphosphate nucleotidase CysQ [Hyphomicrobium sp.]|nr:3'(2'),5'-bisphosphate nucleotidase CysQ [Hyphomicrobium sp.]
MLAERLFRPAIAAGACIMRHFDAGTQVLTKADGSPVTAADREAEAIIAAALAEIAPGIPVIAEEAASRGEMLVHGETFFLVDPLDGTREFAARRPEFTVNIALVKSRVPVFGLIYAPAMSQLYWTAGSEHAFKAQVSCKDAPASLEDVAAERLSTRAAHSGGLTIVASRSHGSQALEDWLRNVDVKDRVNIGSSLKFCLVAEGKADLYPRFGPTKEWDTAAGHAIVLAAGGSVTRADGTPLLYAKREANYLNPSFIVWSGAPRAALLGPVD